MFCTIMSAFSYFPLLVCTLLSDNMVYLMNTFIIYIRF